MLIPGFPKPDSASAASRTSGSSILSTLDDLCTGLSSGLAALVVSIGLPTSTSGVWRGILAGPWGGKVWTRGGSGAHSLWSFGRVDEASGRSRDFIPGRWRSVSGTEGGVWVGTEGRCSESGSCWVYAGGGG